MEAYLDLAAMEATLKAFAQWLVGEVFVISTLAQLLVVVVAYLPARFSAKPLESALEKTIAAPWADKVRAKLRQILKPMVMPLVWLVLMGTARFAAQSLQLPFGLIQVGISLITAWIAIRLAVNFIADPWWSRAMALFVWTVAALDIIGLLDLTVAFLDAFALNMGEAHISLLGVIKALVALAVFLWMANTASRLVEKRLRAISHLTPSQQVLFGKLTRVVLVTIAVLVAINSVGIDLTALAVFSGAVGLGVGLGLQKVVSNLLSGVILLMDRSVKPGDVIAINKTYGWINAIGARYVSVITRDGIEHLIPNEELISRPVENWSYSNRLVRQRLPIGVSYESDIHKAIELAVQAASEFERIKTSPEPKCLLKGFGDSSVDLELRVWIEDAEMGLSNIKSQIYLRIWDLFKEHDIHFPYPQRDIHVRGAVPVRIENGPD